jgi:hypothetical protein
MENEARASLRTRVSLEIIFVVMIGEKKQEKKVRCFSLTTMKRNVRVTWDGGHFGKKKKVITCNALQKFGSLGG